MTIALANSFPVQYAGNGSALTFSFPWKISAASDLVVGFIAGGIYGQQTSGYTIPISSIGNNGGGQITFSVAPPLGTTLDLRTVTPETQTTEFANLTAYLPENSTNTADRLVRMVQDLFRLSYTFGIHGPDTENVAWTTLPNAATRANTGLVFDVNGLPTIGVIPTTVFNQALFNNFLASATLYPQSAIEIAAGVTPSNYIYPPGYVMRYGALANGGATDGGVADTAAITSAHAVCNQSMSGAVAPDFFPLGSVDMVFSPGDYVYIGTGLTASSWYYRARGSGSDCTRIRITQNVYLWNPNLTANNGVVFAGVSGLHTDGGKGVFVATGAFANTMSQFEFEDLICFNYTETAIGSLMSDSPHWKFRNCQFHGALGPNTALTFIASVGGMTSGTLSASITAANYVFTFADGEVRTVTVGSNGTSCSWSVPLNALSITTATTNGERLSFGLVFAGRTDGVDINNVEFQENKASIKLVANPLTSGGNAINIRENIFERWTTSPSGTPSYSMWIVPSVDTPTEVGGMGFASIIEGNRVGNENLLTTDYHILVSDENTGVGTSSLNYLPTLTTSTGFAGGFQIINNVIFGTQAASRACVYSYTPNWWGVFSRNYTYGTPISLQDFYPAAMTDTYTAQNATGEIEQMHLGTPSFLMTNPSTYYMGPVRDPLSCFQSYANVPQYWRAGFDPTVTELTTQLVASFNTNSCTVTSITDAWGGNEAVEINVTGTAGGINTGVTTPTTGKIGFIEFDLMQGSSNPVTQVQIALTDSSGTNNAVVQRQYAPMSGWRRIRLPFCINAGNATINNLSFISSAAGKFRIGRVRCYHAYEPVHIGTKTLDSGLTSWTAGAIGSGAQVTTTVSVAGAAVGDFVLVVYGANQDSVNFSGYVSAANTVTVVAVNTSGSTQTPAATTALRVRVFKGL